MFGRIVVCVDPSPMGQQACAVATEMAARFGGHLTLLAVLPGSGTGPHADLDRLVPMDSGSQSLPQMLEHAQTEALAKGARAAEIIYLHGNAVEAIVEHLERSPPDLVVVGTRGLSRGSRLILGSVSMQIVTQAPCPVLVIRKLRRTATKPG
jgi:nucleotide-binding universal stress UspA family protein